MVDQELPMVVVGTSELLIRMKDVEPAGDGGAWILNADEPWVMRMSEDGTVMGSWGVSGAGPDELRGPMTLVGSGDGLSVWVLDGATTLSGADLTLVRIGGPETSGARLPLPLEGERPVARYADPDDAWIEGTAEGFLRAVADAGSAPGLRSWRARLVRFRADGTREEVFSPGSVLGDPATRYPDAPLFLPFPLWSMCPDGGFALYDPLQNALRRFASSGAELDGFRLPPEQRIEITFDRVARMAYGMTAATMPELDSVAIAGELRRAWDESQGRIAGTFPEYGDLRCPAQNDLWLQPFTLDDDALGGGRGPRWLRISGDGGLSAFRLPRSFIPLTFDADRIWGAHRDDLGVESLAWVPQPTPDADGRSATALRPFKADDRPGAVAAWPGVGAALVARARALFGRDTTPDGLLSYRSLGLDPPSTWDELRRAQPELDTTRAVVTPDVFGRMWHSLRVVAPGGSAGRVTLSPVSIRVELISPGLMGMRGPYHPLVYFMSHSQEGFHHIGRHVVVPVGSELRVRASDWEQFTLEEGRLRLLENGVEFIPGPVEVPAGLCEAVADRLSSEMGREICGAGATDTTDLAPAGSGRP